MLRLVMPRFFVRRLLGCALVIAPLAMAQNATPVHTIGIAGDQFVLDGKPLQIISGELHYERIPREYWRDRLKKARALGLNTISTYVFWNVHEPQPGVYDFGGMHDVAAFVRMAQEEGLYVILRPGPYSCAEWDLGGFPAWLLADPEMVLRSSDEKFLAPAERWLKRLGAELAPLQVTRGGPIIAVQVENEYGSFGDDKNYLKRILAALRNAGLGEVLLYTADGGDELAAGTLPDIHAVVNFGPGDAKEEFAKLQKFRPGHPMMSGEYWAGWFDHWGEKHHDTDVAQQAQELDWILSQGYSINLYMFHGGTSFGFMNGANWDHKNYEPDVTSYDYDSPVSESGALTKKYFAFREVIVKHRAGVPFPDPPAVLPVTDVPEFELAETAPLWAELAAGDQLGAAAHDGKFRAVLWIYFVSHENQSAGRRRIRDSRVAQLRPHFRQRDACREARPQEETGSVAGRGKRGREPRHSGRGHGPHQLHGRVAQRAAGNRRSSHGRRSGTDGLGDFPLPMDDLSKLSFSKVKVDASGGPAFYRGQFELRDLGDTFLDTRGWGKGAVWINGHALGRFWNVGPQQTLYVPAPWLRSGSNEIIVFAQGSPKNLRIRGLRAPVLDELGSE